jgi:hypothetical protein
LDLDREPLDLDREPLDLDTEPLDLDTEPLDLDTDLDTEPSMISREMRTRSHIRHVMKVLL